MKRLFLVYVFFLLLHPLAVSQNREVNFKRFTLDQGLSMNFVTCIGQDTNGFIWVGTNEGLNKYDGYKFSVFKNDPNDSTSLSNSLISVIYQDKQGTLYIGSENGGFSIYNPLKNNFLSFKNKPEDTSSISSNKITAIFEDSNGVLWVGTGNAGLNIFDRVKKKFTRLTHDPNNSHSIISNLIRTLDEDKNGNLWIGTENGISVMSQDRKKFTHYVKNKNDNNSLTTNAIRKIFVDSEGEIWVGTVFGGLHLYDKKIDGFIIYRQDYSKPEHVLGDYIAGICEDKEGQIWVATHMGITVINKKSNTFTDYNNDAFNSNSLVDNGLNAIYKDNADNIWLGTIAGLAMKEALPPKFQHFAHIPGKPNSMSSKEVFCFYEDKLGDILIGARPGFDRFSRNPTTFIHHQTTEKGVLLSSVTSFLEDRDFLWIGNYDFLIRYHKKTKRHEFFTEAAASENLVPLRDIHYILKDAEGTLWVGSSSKGIFKYLEDQNRFEQFVWEGKYVPTVGITAFCFDKKGNTWLGTIDGLFKINKKKGIYNVYKNEINNAQSISDNYILSLSENKDSNFWIGTRGGLNFFDQKSNRFKNFDEKNGLPNNVINSIIEDDNGSLWIGTNKGISNFDPSKKIFKNYTVEDGLQHNEFWHRAALKLRSGELMFGGLNGFNIFDPVAIKENKEAPKIFITDFQIFNKSISIGGKDSPLVNHISETKELTLSYKHSVFSFEFVALNYIGTKNNQYAYKLEGFDKEWNNVGTQRKATYTNIDPGEYVFKVKGSNNDGLWNTAGTAIKLSITPPFWQAWWFKTLVGASLCICLLTFYIVRVGAMERKRAALEQLVHVRTQSLAVVTEEERKARKEAELMREVADNANRAKSSFLATMSHEIRTPMNGVIGMASLLRETNLNEEQIEYAEIIRTSGESLLSIINDILDFSKIESGNMELDVHDLDLRTCVEEVLDVFSAKAATLGLDLLYQIDHNVPANIIADGLRLRQILINLVSNAIKFTQKGEIFVGIRLKDATSAKLQLEFEVRDTGIGIPESKMERLFKAFTQVDSSTTRKYGGTGLGLVISEKLVALMGGEIKVQSVMGNGTTFSFTMNTEVSTAALVNYVYFNTDGLQGKNMLIVDDNSTNRRILQAQLQQWKFSSVLADSGEQALKLLSETHNFDMIITDMQMPDMDGIELAKAIREKNTVIPMILLSSIGDEQRKNNENLFCQILTKPVKLKDLSNAITSGLRNQSKSQNEAKVPHKILSIEFAAKYPLQILIAEDNPVNQKLAVRTLNKLGYEPGLAVNGQLAIVEIERKHYDIVLMDVQMPEMDGLEATRYLRKKMQEQPIIVAMTANALTEDREICIQSGMNDYISKPIKLEILMAVLEKWAIYIRDAQKVAS